jgi:MgtE intracellular N domain
MTTTPAAPAPQAGQARTLHLSDLLRHPLTDTGGEPIGRLSALLGRGGAESDPHQFREWSRFEPLIGHTGSLTTRGPFGRIRRLKPAQIADLIEDASKEEEETEILGQVHADPELEADVFEELDEDLATRLLGARTDAEIAEVLSRMRADDAADAIAELPQARRQPVLDLLLPDDWRRREAAQPPDAHRGDPT